MKGWWKDQLTGRDVGWLSNCGSVSGGVSGGVTRMEGLSG